MRATKRPTCYWRRFPSRVATSSRRVLATRLVFPYHNRPNADEVLFPQFVDSGHPAPMVPARLFHGKNATPFTPILVDSGADHAIFDASAADLLGFDYTTGIKRPIKGVGEAECWVHENIGLALKDSASNHVALSIRAAFTPNFGLAGLVGREYFFEAFVVTFDELNRQVALELREDAPNLRDWSEVPIYKPPLPPHKQRRRPR